VPVSELVVLQRRLGEMIEFRNNKVLIPFEFDPAFGPGEQPIPPPFTSTFSLTFQATSLLPFPPPSVHQPRDAYFYYTGALQTVDWGDGTVETIGETTPVSFAYKSHTYAADGTYTITVTAHDLIGLWLFNLIHPPGPVLPNPADNSQPGMLGIDVTGSPQLEDFDCQYTAVTALTGLAASTMLDTLRCNGCAGLTSLATTAWPALTVLECGATGVTALNLTANTLLQVLDIDAAPIITVDLTPCAATINSVSAAGCTALTHLTSSAASLPALASVNVAGDAPLKVIALPNAANLSILNLTGATGLTVLFLAGAVFLTGTLDLTGRAALGVLNIDSCAALTGVTLTGCAALSNFVFNGAGLTTLDVTPCTALITVLGSGATALTVLLGLSGKTALTGVNLTGCTALIGVGILSGCTALTSINFTGCTVLTAVAIDTSPNVTAVTVTGCSALTTITVNGSKIPSQTFTGCTSLGAVYLPGNTLLTSIGVVPNAGLQYLVLSGCTSLTTTLNLGIYPNLVGLNVSGSGVIGLSGLAGLAALSALNVSSCNLSAVAFSIAGCGALRTLDALATGSIDQAEVDAALARMATNAGSFPSGSVDLRVGGSVTPSTAGWTSYAIINGTAGWSALVNGSPPVETSSFSFTSNVGASQTVYFDYISDAITVDWGDGVVENLPAVVSLTPKSHLYSTAGTYICKLSAYSGAQITGIHLISLFSSQLFITAVDVSNAPDLQFSIFSNTGITTLDLTGATALLSIAAESCPNLTAVDTGNAASLQTLSLRDATALTAVTLTTAAALQSIDVTNCTVLTSLDLTGATSLTGVYISGSSLAALDLTACTPIGQIGAIGCPALFSINGLRNKTNLYIVNIYNSANLAAADVTGCSSLLQFNASGCDLDQASVDSAILQGSANKTPFGTPGTIDVAGGTNAVPSLSDTAVFSAINNLLSPPGAWTILYNTGSNQILAYSYWDGATTGTPTVYGSADSGTSWYDAGLGLPFDSNTSSIQLVRYGAGRLLAISSAVAPATSSAVAVSTDRGSTWTLAQPNPSYALVCEGGIDWNGVSFVVAMNNLLVTVNPFYTSVDGINWSGAAPISGTAADLFTKPFDVAAEYGANPGRWAVSGAPAASAFDVYISQSADVTAANWQPQNVFGATKQLIKLSSGSFGGITRWIACGIVVSGSPSSVIYYGDDTAGNGTGITWTAATGGSVGVVIYDIAFNGTYFVAVGGGGTILTSTDGITWAGAGAPPGSPTLSNVVYDRAAGYWLMSLLDYDPSGQVYLITSADPNTAGSIVAQPSYPSTANMRDIVILA
jgi:uncharacterized protein YjbI with pentapeptide repeats